MRGSSFMHIEVCGRGYRPRETFLLDNTSWRDFRLHGIFVHIDVCGRGLRLRRIFLLFEVCGRGS